MKANVGLISGRMCILVALFGFVVGALLVDAHSPNWVELSGQQAAIIRGGSCPNKNEYYTPACGEAGDPDATCNTGTWCENDSDCEEDVVEKIHVQSCKESCEGTEPGCLAGATSEWCRREKSCYCDYWFVNECSQPSDFNYTNYYTPATDCGDE